MTIENSFRSARETYPSIFISTPYDQNGSIWTRKAPSTLILNRISSLAKQSLKLVDALFEDSSLISFGSLFRPPMSGYDCLIHTKTSLNPRRLQFLDLPDTRPSVDVYPFKLHSQQRIPVIEFDPIQCYLRELRVSIDP